MAAASASGHDLGAGGTEPGLQAVWSAFLLEVIGAKSAAYAAAGESAGRSNSIEAVSAAMSPSVN